MQNAASIDLQKGQCDHFRMNTNPIRLLLQHCQRTDLTKMREREREKRSNSPMDRQGGEPQPVGEVSSAGETVAHAQ